jgi:regulator of sigma E protease
MFLLIFGLILFLLLVVLHEFGHFIAARRGGVEVEEFGLGFPPKLWGKKFKGHKTEYTINALPLGGFVKLKGEHDSDTAKGSYGAARLRTKIAIMLAGVGMNFATAWFLLTLLALIGLPLLPLPNGEKQFSVARDTKVISNQIFIGFVEQGSPAEKAGIKAGDRLTGLDCAAKECNPIKEASDVRSSVKKLLGQGQKTIDLGVNGKQISVTPRSLEEIVESEKRGESKGYIGIEPVDFTLTKSTWSAPVVGAGLTAQYTKITLSGIYGALKNLFTGHATQAGESVSGPIGIFFVLKQGAELGYRYILIIVALLSVTLAVMNVLPIPALDGGRLFVTSLFRIMKKPLTQKLEERIHGTGFLALMALFVLISIVDIRRFF